MPSPSSTSKKKTERTKKRNGRRSSSDAVSKKNLVITTPQDVRGGLRGLVSGSERPFLMLVHAPWCHFCRELRPQWERLLDWLSDTGVRAVEMDMSMLPEERNTGEGSLIREMEAEHAKAIEGVPFVALALPAGAGFAFYDQFVLASDPERVLVGGEAERPRSALHMLRFVEAGLRGWRQQEGTRRRR